MAFSQTRSQALEFYFIDALDTINNESDAINQKRILLHDYMQQESTKLLNNTHEKAKHQAFIYLLNSVFDNLENINNTCDKLNILRKEI